MSETENVV